MGNSAERDVERLWLEEKLLHYVKLGARAYDFFELYDMAIPQKLPELAGVGIPVDVILNDFCGLTCCVENAPARFATRKSKFRRAMVNAALARLERDCRIEHVIGVMIKKPKCRPARFERTLCYRRVGLMDALARASVGPEDFTTV